MTLYLTQVELIILATAVRNEIEHRERMCQEIGLCEDALNVQDIRRIEDKIKNAN